MTDRPATPDTDALGFDALRYVMRDQTIGAASKLAYRELYARAQEAGGPEIVITAANLAAACGARDGRSARSWLAELGKHGLVDVVDRDRRRGTILIYIYKPNPGQPMGRPDPQKRLPFGELPRPAEAAEILARKFPRKDFRQTEIVAQGFPPDKPLPPNDLGRGAEISAQGFPRALIDTKETKETLLPKSQGITRFNESNGARATADRAAPIGTAVAAALDDFCHASRPSDQKRKLEDAIRSVVCDPNMAGYVSGKAADLVVFHAVPEKDLDQVLVDLEAMRAAGTLRSPGAFFHAQIRRVAGRRGIDWETMKRIEKAAHD